MTLFTDSGNNESSDFSGYHFQFNSDETITASRNNLAKTGTWNINRNSQKFNVNFGTKADNNSPLGELADDWKILTITPTELKLTDDNTASNEHLTFTKANLETKKARLSLTLKSYM